MKELRHIFWDWNGTLLNDAWLCRDVMNTILRERDMPEMSPARYQEIFDFPIRRYYDRLGFDFEKETFESLGLLFIDRYERRRAEAALYADARECLNRVDEMGIGQSILSAYKHDTLVRRVREHELEPFFHTLNGHHHIYPSDKTPQGRQALEELGMDPGETVLIGDTTHDADVAEELGMRCVIIPGGNQPEAALRNLGVPCAATRKEALSLLLDSSADLTGRAETRRRTCRDL